MILILEKIKNKPNPQRKLRQMQVFSKRWDDLRPVNTAQVVPTETIDRIKQL
jgi:hypothetical protein